MTLQQALRELMARYPNTDKREFLDLYPFDGIGQPVKSDMLHLFTLHALGHSKAAISPIKEKCFQGLLSIIFAPSAEKPIRAKHKAFALLMQEEQWTTMFNEIVRSLEATQNPDETLEHQADPILGPELV